MNKKIYILFIVGMSLCFISCFNKGGNGDDVTQAFREAKQQLSLLYDNESIDADIKRDSIMLKIMCLPGSFEYPVDSILSMPHYSSLSEDGRVKLITICGAGSMETGVSYLQYKRGDESLGCIKIADVAKHIDGGAIFPACYREIHSRSDKDYAVYGTFRFDVECAPQNDTLVVSAALLK